MKFNKDQREGLAKVADNLATAAMVAATIGVLIDHKIGIDTAAGLLGAFIVLLFLAYRLREGDEDDR